MDYKLELATPNQIEEILSLYQNVIETTFTTWDKNYPSKDLLISDIQNKNLYVLR